MEIILNIDNNKEKPLISVNEKTEKPENNNKLFVKAQFASNKISKSVEKTDKSSKSLIATSIVPYNSSKTEKITLIVGKGDKAIPEDCLSNTTTELLEIINITDSLQYKHKENDKDIPSDILLEKIVNLK